MCAPQHGGLKRVEGIFVVVLLDPYTGQSRNGVVPQPSRDGEGPTRGDRASTQPPRPTTPAPLPGLTFPSRRQSGGELCHGLKCELCTCWPFFKTDGSLFAMLICCLP